MSRKYKPLASAAIGVQAVLKSSELMQALRPHMAKARWAEVVGAQVAGVTQVEKVQGTELVVRVKNSTWAHELTFLKGDIVRRLNAALGGPVLTDIRFKASGLAQKKTPEKTLPAPALPGSEALKRVALPAATLARIEAAAQGIADEALRGRVRLSLLRAARMDAAKQAQNWQPCARCATLTPPCAAPILCPLCRITPMSSTAPHF